MAASLPFRLVAATAVLLPSLAVHADPPRQLPPRDNSCEDRAFAETWLRFKMAVVQRNSEAVMAMLDPEVHLSFGGDMGRDAFIEMWRPSDKESELWRELEEIIYLGGAFDSEEGTSFAAPSLFADFGSDPNDDAFTQLLIKGRNVRLRAEPSLDASIIATASWEIVERVSDWQNEQWVQVLRSDGTKGWVAAEFLRSPIDYRIIFSKGPTGWKIAAFIAGD